MNPIILSAGDLAIASALVLASAALSFTLALRAGRSLLLSALRMVVQLVLVGLALRWIFDAASVAVTVAVILLMLVAASREVGARSARKLRGAWQLAIGAVSVFSVTVPVVLIVLTTALRPTPWYDARHMIPLAGIVLGTVMNGASLAMNAVLSGATRDRLAIEAHLALGATAREAFGLILRQAVRIGVTPTVNQMAAAGLITLPGIMTGQVLAGMDPLDAAKYQILLMFVLAGGGFFGAVAAAYAAVRRLTDSRHRLRLDRLEPAK